MLKLHKSYVLNERQKPIAVQIPIAEFECLEEIIENYGLSKLMDETQNEERLSGNEAKKYYQPLKQNVEKLSTQNDFSKNFQSPRRIKGAQK